MSNLFREETVKDGQTYVTKQIPWYVLVRDSGEYISLVRVGPKHPALIGAFGIEWTEEDVPEDPAPPIDATRVIKTNIGVVKLLPQFYTCPVEDE